MLKLLDHGEGKDTKYNLVRRVIIIRFIINVYIDLAIFYTLFIERRGVILKNINYLKEKNKILGRGRRWGTPDVH